MKTIPTLFKLASAMMCLAQACVAHAGQSEWTSFQTPIKCKTFDAQLVSICQPTRKHDNPAVCKSQILEFQQPYKRNIVLFNAVKPRTEGEYLMIGQHAFNWFCSQTGKDGAEILSLNIANWFNARDEKIIMFDNQGHRLSPEATHQIAKSQAWQDASAYRQTDTTAHGSVVEPEFE